MAGLGNVNENGYFEIFLEDDEYQALKDGQAFLNNQYT